MAVQITEIFYPKTRLDWRNWLVAHHDQKTEIWIQLYKKATEKPSLSYEDLVEECLCFGWIDGIVKKLDEESTVRRITPRRKKSFLSELNRQRIWKLQLLDKMTPAGLVPTLVDQIGSPDDPLIIPDWIEAQLRADQEIWQNFQAFPHFYKRLKIGWIAETGTSERRLPEAKKRLQYLLKMTKQEKRYGTYPMENLDK